jgi:hypothetical protein
MGAKKSRKIDSTGFTGYTDAPPEIDKAIERSVQVDDFLPRPGKLVPKTATRAEREQTRKAWKRYRIKDHERGHRTPLSKILREPTRRLDTSIILPLSVFDWLKTKPNKAAFIRETVIKRYKKTA